MLKKRARDWELRNYPEQANEEPESYEFTCVAPDRAYIYFGPSFHIRRRLITQGIIDDLLSNKSQTLISVGAGGAHLERFIVDDIGIDISKITLSDKYVDDLPKGFKSYQFDHTTQWPSKVGQFDYILFPASIDFSIFGRPMTFEEQDTSDSNLLVTCVRNAYPHLIPRGEIRISDHVLSDKVINDARVKISAIHPDLDMATSRPDLNDSIVVKKQ